jgi:hypothetical protein
VVSLGKGLVQKIVAYDALRRGIAYLPENRLGLGGQVVGYSVS